MTKEVDITSLSVGQKFKNLQQLSLTVLGEKLPPGKGRENRIKKMQHYFSWRTVPNSQKIIITEIYSSKRKPLSPKSIYAPLLYKELASYPGELIFTKTEMLLKLGIVNKNFDEKNFVNTANALKIKYKNLRIIHTDIYTRLNDIVLKALSQLEEHNYISIEKSKEICYMNSSSRKVTKEEVDQIYKEQQILLSCNNYFEVIKKNLVNQYTSMCKAELSKIGINRVKNIYKISILRPMESTPTETTLASACQNYLLKRFSSNSLAQKVINFYTQPLE